ncbi:TIR domain-containing protein [Cyanothece sp. BG0011]|nr:TIR domain-containing protein [Cyanothece sp. BG0011]
MIYYLYPIIIFFTPDDISHIRDQQYQSVRDNVIFE